MHRLLFVITAFLLAVSCYRAFSFAVHDPVYGYANNYDMYRLQVCFGVWPTAGKKSVSYGRSIEAPKQYYREMGKQDAADCYHSSESLFVSLALFGHSVAHKLGIVRNRIDIRWVGVTRALAFASLLATIVLFFSRSSVRAAALASFAGASFLTDPINTLFFNGFYCEFSVVFFAIASTALALFPVVRPPTVAWLLLFSLSLLGLGTSKTQFMLLPMVLAFLNTCFLWKVKPWRMVGVALIFLVTIVPVTFQEAQLSRPGLPAKLKEMNRTNSLLFGLLPKTSDPATAITSLALPERCNEMVLPKPKKFSPHRCPEIADVRLSDVLFLMLKNPGATVSLLREGLPLSRPWLNTNVGHIEGESHAEVPLFSIGRIIQLIPIEWYSFTVATLLLLCVADVFLSLIGLGLCRRQTQPLLGASSVSMASLTLYTYATAVVGDGHYELWKHTHLLQSTLPLWLILATIRTIQLLRSSPDNASPKNF